MVRYDSRVLYANAQHWMTVADGMVRRSIALGAIIGAVLALVPGAVIIANTSRTVMTDSYGHTATVNSSSQSVGVALFCALLAGIIGGMIGHGVGASRAWKIRLDVQRSLVLVAIEENTRGLLPNTTTRPT